MIWLKSVQKRVKPYRNESIFRDMAVLNQIPQELQLSRCNISYFIGIREKVQLIRLYRLHFFLYLHVEIVLRKK